MQIQKRDPLSRLWITALLALVCCLLWGSAFPAVKVSYKLLHMQQNDWASQMVFAGIRFFLAGILALAAGSLMEKKPLIPARAAVPKIILLSLFQTILQYFFYYIGLAHTTGVKASILVAANVFFAILFSALLFRQEKLTVRKIVGCLVGFSGIVLVNCGGFETALSLDLLGDGFILLCTVASGLSSAFMKKFSAGEDPVLLSGWQFVFGGSVMWLTGAACGGSFGLTSPESLGLLLYLAFVSAAAYTLWSVLLRHNPVSRVAVFGFLNPLCGVILSSLILHETGAFSWTGAVSLVLVCAGILIVNRQGTCNSSENVL